MTKSGDLLKAWQKQPNEALRALILAHDEREPLEALRGLEHLKTAVVIERLGAFKGTKVKDPRLTRALEELVLACPWSADSSKPVWRAIFEAVARSGDARFKTLKPTFQVRPTMQDWLQKQFTAAIEELPTAFPGSDEARWKKELASLPAKKVAPDAKDEAGLFANVYAHPLDDAPRLVLADFLTEKGDPRGEFITLQYAPQRDLKRERALLKQHGKKWLGALAPVIGVEVDWARGFPVRGLVKFKAERDAVKYGGLPEWSTFEELTWAQPGASAAKDREWTQYFSSAFRHLKHANNVFFPHLLASKEPFARLETIATWIPEASHVKDFAQSKNFPKLHTLRMLFSPPAGWFRGIRQLGAVKTLQVNAHDEEVKLWLDVARGLTIDVLKFGDSFTFRRNAKGAFTQLTVDLPAERTHYWMFSDIIPTGVVETLAFTGDGKLPADEEKKLRAKVGAVKDTPAPSPDAVPPLDGELTWLDGTRVAAESDGQLFFIDVTKGPKLVSAHAGERSVTSLVKLPTGALLISNATSLRTVDAKTGQTLWSLKHPYVSTDLIDWSADGTKVSRGRIGVFDLEAKKLLPVPRGAKDDLRTPEDRYWIRSVPGKNYQVRRPDVRLGVELVGGHSFLGMISVEDGLVAHAIPGLTKWNVETGEIAAQVKSKDASLPRVAPKPSSNKRFIVAMENDDEVFVATLPELKVVGRAKAKGIDRMAVSDDGKKVAVIADSKLSVLDVK